MNELKCCINEVDLQDRLYVAVTIGTGFAPREVQVNEERLFIGSAGAKIFSNYMKCKMEEKYSIHMTATVSMKSTSFIWKTTTDRYVKELQLFMNELYEGEINEQQLLTVKQATIERYKKNYKDLEFRGRMKIQEFTHYNKSFVFDQLSQDLLDVNLSVVQTVRQNIFVPNQTIIFCHGKAKREEFKQLTIPNGSPSRVIYLFDAKSERFLQNQQFKQQSKGNFWCGSMKFERTPTLTDLAKEYVVLNLIGDIMNKGSYLVEVDPLDASIIYDQNRAHSKNDLRDIITDENVQIAKKRIYLRLDRELKGEPEQFMEKVGRLFVNQIDYFDCLSHLDDITANDIHDFFHRRDYKIREGSVMYYKEAKSYVI